MNTYWWFRPSRIALLIVMPIAYFAYAAPVSFYRKFGASNAITDEHFFLAWLSILSFAAASWLGEILLPNRWWRQPLGYIRESIYRVPQFGLAWIAILATCIFLAPFINHLDIVIGVLSGEGNASDSVREYSNSIRGITSQENLSGLVVVLFILKPRLTGGRRTKIEKLVLMVILALTVVKVVLNTERLALIEVLIPLSLVIGGLRRQRSAVWALAPVYAIGGLFLYFMATEYLRSWTSFYSTQYDSLIDFAMSRLIGYYITAINNGAFIYSEGHSYYFPAFTAGWLWRLPFPDLANWLTSISGVKIDIADLLSGQNIEFNNTSGIFAPLTDFGPVLGVVVWTMLGYASGLLYRLFAQGQLFGLILFPTWYVGVLEIPRVFIWGNSRYFPPLVVSIVITYLLVLLGPHDKQAASTHRLRGDLNDQRRLIRSRLHYPALTKRSP